MDNSSEIRGLTTLEAKQRAQFGQANVDPTGGTKTIKQIVLSNVLTLFNLINVILALALLCVGSFKNMTFMIIIICNVAIGILQEIRAKKTIDKLSFLSASKVCVLRDGEEIDIPSDHVVRDDVMILSAGNQIQADAIILSGACQVDESFLTGEADAIAKETGDRLMAGSYLVNGKCYARVTAVGKDKYVSSISAEARRMKKVRSEIMTSLQWIVRIVSIIIVPLGITIFMKQLGLDGATVKTAIEATTASIISMIPEGLMLLTSTALAVSVIRLARSKVLVQQLYCIETLARVDTLCLDKTGTLTEGAMEVIDVIHLTDDVNHWVPGVLTGLCKATPDPNATTKAILERFPISTGTNTVGEPWQCTRFISFSSKTKWSGATFAEEGTFCMGAAEFLLPNMSADLKHRIAELSQLYRVLLVVHSDEGFVGDQLPNTSSLMPIALVLLRDKIRKEAASTIAYFKEQGVAIKIISGDSPETVSGIAKATGVEGWDQSVDASRLITDADIAEAARKYTVFGRVTPQQKRKLVASLKKAGHTVAMTGDGVNDVLALKEADCSIAMAGGADAARNASELVLLNSNFDALPKVVAEGRRCINNVQRSAALFLTKTVYAFLLAVMFVFLDMAYPFIPIQMSLISAACIGVPALLLALQPNHDLVRGHFLKNVVSKAVPGGLAVALNIGFVLFCGSQFQLDTTLVSTLCVVISGFTGLVTLYRISKPFNVVRIIIFILMNVFFWGAFLGFPSFFQLRPFDAELSVFMLMYVAAAYGTLTVIYRIFEDAWRNFKTFLADRKAKRAAKKEAKMAAKKAAKEAEREAWRRERAAKLAKKRGNRYGN